MMMTLGSYRFSINTAAYQSKERTTIYRWGKQDRLDYDPVLHFVGPVMTLSICLALSIPITKEA